jgi:TetR/AcrR family transcriptional regulator, fatty acid metabolism regulator protein
MEQRKKRPKHSSLGAKQKDQKRRQIVRAAVKVFAEIGYHSATMEDIAREFGAPKGLLYSHFKSKEQVLDAILNDEELIAQLEAPLVPFDGPLDQAISWAIARSSRLFRSNAHLVRVLYLQSITADKQPELPFKKMLERLYNMAARWLDHYKRTGEIRPEVDSRLWAELLVDAFTNVILKKPTLGDGEIQLGSLLAVLEMLFDGTTTETGRGCVSGAIQGLIRLTDQPLRPSGAHAPARPPSARQAPAAARPRLHQAQARRRPNPNRPGSANEPLERPLSQ